MTVGLMALVMSFVRIDSAALDGAVMVGIACLVSFVLAVIICRPKVNETRENTTKQLMQVGASCLLPQLLGALGTLFTEAADLKISTWGGKGETALFGDIGIQDIDKATAISLLLKYLHMGQKDTIAFGDAAVDIPMLEYCALGIAMASGGKEIKAMADDITAAVNQDGLYKAFLKYNLL